MTPQEIFDKAVDGMLKQGVQSMNECGSCVYRSSDGLKCAVGHVIPDELYDPGMDDQTTLLDGTAIEAILRHYDDLPAWMHEHKVLLTRLQTAHDGPLGWVGGPNSLLKKRLVDVAEDYDLKFDPSKYTWAE